MKRYSNAVTHTEDIYAQYLSILNVHFLRQEVICLNCGYHAQTIRDECPICKTWKQDVAVVDFLIEDPLIVIEIKGSIHDKRKHELKDIEREKHLYRCGYVVISLTNQQVDDIWKAFKKRQPTWEQSL